MKYLLTYGLDFDIFAPETKHLKLLVISFLKKCAYNSIFHMLMQQYKCKCVVLKTSKQV
jgi:hypothetical protein